MSVIFSSCLTVNQVASQIPSAIEVVEKTEDAVETQELFTDIVYTKNYTEEQITQYLINLSTKEIEDSNYMEAFHILSSLQRLDSPAQATIENMLEAFSPNGYLYEDIQYKLIDEDLYRFDHWNGKCGYLNSSGEIVIEPKFDTARPFSEGLALVTVNGLKHFIDSSGQIVLSEIEDDDLSLHFIDSFNSGLCLADIYSIKDELYGRCFIDREGNIVIPPSKEDERVNFSSSFSEDLAKVETANGIGFIDTKGNIAIKPQFYDAHDFHDGIAAVSYDLQGFWGYISKDGDAIKPIFKETSGMGISNFNSGLALGYYKQDETYIFIDKHGDIVIDLKEVIPADLVDINFITNFYEGFAIVKAKDNSEKEKRQLNDKYVTYIINKSGDIVFQLPSQLPIKENSFYNNFNPRGIFSYGSLPVYLDKFGFGFINYFGNFTMSPVTQNSSLYKDNANISNCKHGLYYAMLNPQEYGYIDEYGEVVYSP